VIPEVELDGVLIVIHGVRAILYNARNYPEPSCVSTGPRTASALTACTFRIATASVICNWHRGDILIGRLHS